jgi:hypothetical protein
MIDGKGAFGRADSFLFSVNFLRRQPMEVLAAMIQAHVLCDAFCTELYMKVLAQLEKGLPALHTHNLEQLAGDLSAKSYRRIKRVWTSKHPEAQMKNIEIPEGLPKDFKIPGTFKDALAASAQAFMDWRYGEGDRAMWWQLGGVPDELREIILEMKPEWRPLGGPRTALDPKPPIVKGEDNLVVRPISGPILNYQPTPIHMKIRRRPDPKDGDAS